MLANYPFSTPFLIFSHKEFVMFTWWQQQSLRKRLALLLFLVLATGVVLLLAFTNSVYEIVRSDHEKALFSARISEARTLADMSDNVGTWAAHYGGMWSRVPTAKVTDPSVGNHLDQACFRRKADGEREDVCFLLKNPALIQREMSDVTERSPSQAKFRLTSDKFVNPSNAPNRFESAALEHMRENNAPEYYEVRGKELLFARRIIASESCLRCHGARDEAPMAMRVQYPLSKGYGYELGKIAGITSVRIPLKTTENTPKINYDDVIKRLGWPTWVGVGLLFLAIAFAFFDFGHNVARLLRILTRSAIKASEAEVGEVVEFPVFSANEFESKNEVHRLSHAIKVFHEALAIKQRHKL
jgi:hypothetical protein